MKSSITKTRGRDWKIDLVDSRANEFAAENYVIQQDGEVSTRLWMLRLFVQDEPRYGHQVRTLSIGRVIHICNNVFDESRQ